MKHEGGPVPLSEPDYWQNEIGHELRPAIMAYLHGAPLTARQIKLIQLYLKQWIDATVWHETAELAALRSSVNAIETVDAIGAWLAAAMDEGIDPL